MERLSRLTPFYVMQILKEASSYPDAIHFEVGEPDLPPPPGVKRALAEAVERERFGYTPSDGLAQLKEKIAAHYHRTYGLEVEPERILVTPGSSGAFLMAYALVCDFGARLGMSDPGYPSYKNFAYILGIEPHFIDVTAKSDYCITPDRIQNIDALQISNPANPTGNIYPDDLLASIAKRCDEKGVWLISDELYHGLVYERHPQSALAFSERAIVIGGFSKYFCMPGLRLGWIVLPKELVHKAQMIAQNIFIAPPTLSQYAALEAFDYPYLDGVRATYQKRRDYLYEALSDLFDIPAKPAGAFYIWADVSRYSDDSTAFAKELLQKIHVAVTPGIDFGRHGTRRFVRFAYTRHIDHMAEGVRRLRDYLASRSAKT